MTELRELPGTPRETDSSPHIRWGFARLTEPLILFPLLALLLLLVQWTATLSMMSDRKASAVEFAETSTRELADTYEAQLLRSLRDISQTLSLLEYVIEPGGVARQLQELSDRGMLPPSLFFTVNVVGEDGELMASTRSIDSMRPAVGSLPESLLDDDSLQVGLARHDPLNDQWWLDFGRAVSGPVSANGVAALIVSVDAEFFVSGYEPARLGQEGALGIVGEDDVVRVARQGDAIDYGYRVPVSALLDALDNDPDRVAVFDYPTDGRQRYTSAREIFDFPLVMVLGLSVEEQHAAAEAENRRTLWLGLGASALMLFALAMLGRLSLQLQRSREKVLEEQRAHARDVEHQAFHDGLTGLPNRSLFSKLLEQAMQEARRNQRGLAVMFLDLDRFKLINDTLGHDAGDALLIEVARRIRERLRGSDVVARLGGDEFILLLREADDREQVAGVAETLLEVVSEPYRLAGTYREITVSLGISLYPKDGEDEQTLIKRADTAMYTAKQAGRADYRFYSEEMEAEPGKY